MRTNILVGDLAGAGKKIEQPEPLAFGTQFSAAKEIAFADDADKVSVGIDDGKAADVMIKHDLRRVHDRRLRVYGDSRCIHDGLDKHARLLV